MAGESVVSNVVSTYTTFSGIDITAIFDNLIISTLSGIATSLTREKVPVYTFGSANARSISRGKRACAGSMQFTLFDRDAFYNLYLDESHYYYAHADEVNYLTNPVNIASFVGTFYDTNNGQLTGAGVKNTNAGGGNTSLNSTGIADVNGNLPTLANGQPNPAFNNATGTQAFGTGTAAGTTNAVGALSVRRAAQHADQVYPFDITLHGQNEYGRSSSSAVIGVEIINEGGGLSVDDITNEQQMTYIAITKTPWVPQTTGAAPEETLLGRITKIASNNNLGADTPVFNQATPSA